MKYFHDKRNIEEFIFLYAMHERQSDLSRKLNINKKNQVKLYVNIHYSDYR